MDGGQGVKVVVVSMVAGVSLVASARVTVTVDSSDIRNEISSSIYGVGMEDVNHEIYGGLDAQRLYGESLEELPKPCDSETIECRQEVSRGWIPMAGWAGELIHDRTKAHGGQASQLMIPNGSLAAMANAGLGNWGIRVEKGRAMVGHFYASGAVGSLRVELQSEVRRQVLASAELDPAPGEAWKRVDFRLVPTASDPKARFVIRAYGYGRLWVDDAYLADEPTNVYGRIGCREDVVAGLEKAGVNFLRWGGTMCNAEDYLLENFGPARNPYRGFWHKHSSGGFGPREFVRLSAAMRVPCAVAIAAREKIPEAVRFAEELKAYDIPIVVQIGNEECIAPNAAAYRQYCELTRALVKAMRAANPKLAFASAAWWTGPNKVMEETFRTLDGVVEYWDLHPFFRTIDQCLKAREVVGTFLKAIRTWNPETKMRAAVFEENGNKHNLERALCHVLVLEKIREAGLDVLTSCPANALQAYGQNDNGWDQGNVFFTPDKVWLAPCAWAQRMARDAHRELRIVGATDDAEVFVSATRDREGKSIVLHLVNVSAEAKSVDLKLSGEAKFALSRVVSLSGSDLDADNAPDEPERVAPVEVTAMYLKEPVLKPYSYTVVYLVAQ